MARNIYELEKELALLEVKKQAQLAVIKQDADAIQELFKPANIIKRSISNWLTPKNGSNSSLGANLAGMAGTFLIEELLFKKSNFVLKLLGSLVTSNLFNDLLKGEDSSIKKLGTKLADWVKSKSTDNSTDKTLEQ
jgi:hypothetical protein